MLAPLCVGHMLSCRVFSLINGLPSPLSVTCISSLFEWFISTMPLSDSSATCRRALRPWPSPAVLLSFLSSRNPGGLPVLVHEVSRRALGSTTTRDCARTRARALAHAAFHHPYSVGIPICSFSKLNSPARLYPCLRFAVCLAAADANLGAEWFATPFS